MIVTDRSTQWSGRCIGFACPEFTKRGFRSLLLMGSASIILLGSGYSAYAEGRTFLWNGNENLTSFGRAGNWDQVLELGGNPVLDGDGNPTFEQIPVTDDDGNPVLDHEENQVYEQGAQIFEPSNWVDGPPDGLDTMVVTTGTPNFSGQPRRVWDLYLSGGEFIVRNSKQAIASFFVDGTLNVSGSGALEIGEDSLGQSVLTAAKVDMTSGSITGWLNPGIDTIGAGQIVITGSMEQSGGRVSDVAMQTPTYALSGGTLSANVDFSTLFALSGAGVIEAAAELAGAEGSTMTQSGGSMDGTVTGIDNYTHSGGSIGGNVSTGIYAVTNEAATSDGGVITAAESFDFTLATGTAIVAAKLSGDGNLIKSGDSTVVLTHKDSDFTGTVAVEAGTLEVIDDALPSYSAVTVAHSATLLMNTANNTVFMGSIKGEMGQLVKQGSASLTLGGDIMLGGLKVDAGKVQVGTGLSENTVSFDYAVVEEGATLYVASGATLTIRTPNNLVNNGTFINDGTVNDDLDNTGPFINNKIYNAKVLSNTGSIDNNSGGLWTGDILGNTNKISNNTGAEWMGDVVSNDGTITNAEGATWTGHIVGNGSGSGFVPIYNRGLWTGDVKANSGFISNDGGTWNGDIVTNALGIISTGIWIGNIKGNNSQISNEGGGVWTGDVFGNNNVIFNQTDSEWTGNVIANGGGSNGLAQLVNRGLWTGNVKGNSGGLYNIGGTWNGDVLANHGDLTNRGSWNGDIKGTDSQIRNHGLWTGGILGNNNAIFNWIDGVWDGDVVANSGGSNIHTQIVNQGDWTGDVQTNARTIENEASGTWNGDVLSNAGTILSSGVWNGDFNSAGLVNAKGEINGAFTNSGQLNITGSLAGITTLSNTGIVSLKGRGTTQVLTVADADFGNSSYYDIDVNAAGASDKIVAQNVVIDGGTVRVTAANTGGTYDPTTIYTIITATDLNGTFDDVTTNLSFLAARLGYEDNAVQLMLKRNDIGFADVGTTRNQQAAGTGAESLGTGNAIYDAALWLSRNEASEAFNSLSGEAYGSFESVSIQSASVIADLVTARVDRAFDTLGDSVPMPVNADATGSEFPRDTHRGYTGVWAELYGALGRVSGDGNTSGADWTMGGIAAGLDGSMGDWQLGTMLHVGHTSAEVDDLNTFGDSTDFGFGLYGGRQWDETRLSVGAAYTWHDWDISRRVSFPGFSNTLSTDYSTGTAQVFGKLSHTFRMGDVSLIPYASLAYVNQSASNFTETGGEAALESQSGTIDATFTTLGLGSNRTFVVGNILLTATAGLGWRHASADTPGAIRTLRGGDSFFIVGESVPRDTIVLNAGFNFNVSAGTTIDVTYDGQIGKNGAESHALKGVWATSF